MSLFDRIATLTKAALHEGLNKLEDPVLLTGQYLRDLDEDIFQAENRERELQSSAKLLERREREYRMLAEVSEGEAVQALGRGDEAAARQAASEKLRYEESGRECAVRLEETNRTLEALEANIAAAKAEKERLQAKRAELLERARLANEQTKRVSEARVYEPGHLDSRYASRGFERMEEKIAGWEAAGAVSRPAASPALDAELERLRAKL